MIVDIFRRNSGGAVEKLGTVTFDGTAVRFDVPENLEEGLRQGYTVGDVAYGLGDGGPFVENLCFHLWGSRLWATKPRLE